MYRGTHSWRRVWMGTWAHETFETRAPGVEHGLRNRDTGMGTVVEGTSRSARTRDLGHITISRYGYVLNESVIKNGLVISEK